VVGIDHCGPYPECGDSTHRVILVVTCLTTGFIACESSKSTDAISTISALSKIFWLYGFPKWVRSDNGAAFRSKSMIEFLTGHGIRASFSPPYHPQSGGKWEISHKSLNHNLLLLTNTRNCSWVKLLKEATFIPNSKPRYGKFSSFELFHTFTPRHPFTEISYSSEWQNCVNVEDFRNHAIKNFESFMKLEAEKSRELSKTTLNSKALSNSVITIGDEVYVKRFGDDKLTYKFKGPYIVFSSRGATVAVRDGSTELIAHVDNVKLSKKAADVTVTPEKMTDVEARLWSVNNTTSSSKNQITVGSLVRWPAENDMFCIGEVKEISSRSALVHRYTIENDETVPSYIKYSGNLFLNLTTISTENLKPFQFTRGSLKKILIP